jgi:hypothetical protein
MPAFSLLTAMPGLPWYLLPIWPLIFWRIQRLKRRFRDVGGPGSEMLWGVMWNGRVVVIQISDDLSMGPQQTPSFHARVSDGLRRALSGETDVPCPLRRLRREMQSLRDCPAAGASAGLANLPLPHT